MSLLLSLPEITERDRPRIGGKGYSLSVMASNGMRVPEAICLSTEAYQEFLNLTGLRDMVQLELGRKAFEEMRWEEIWDTALRIRNLFLKTDIPTKLSDRLLPGIESRFKHKTVAIRSSAPGEDAAKTSFAGLHESYINIRGEAAILEHVRLVWASLWSDRALLYRRELGLNPGKSAMAVVIQEMLVGERSGVVFGRSPMDEAQSVIEAVYGLNQGLVDGTVEPDRWLLDRKTGLVFSHRAPSRDKFLSPSTQGAELKSLPPEQKDKTPLNPKEVKEVFGLAMKAEDLFRDPQDVEWTYRSDLLHILQARPITTLSKSNDDQRPWYLSLQRSFENLKILRLKIEQEVLPAMEEEAAQLVGKELSLLTDQALANEIEHRLGALKKWQRTYREDCIPFAHGMRLFGQVYNDVMKPKDPFAFIELLRGVDMVSLQRNRKLQDLAARIRTDEALAEGVRSNKIDDIDPEFRMALSELAGQFGDLAWGSERFDQDMNQLLHFLLEMASRPPEKGKPLQQNVEQLEQEFLSRFHSDRRDFAIELLDLARASYRLRDDDNTYLGRIEGQLILAVNEGKSRLQKKIAEGLDRIGADQMIKVLRGELEFEASATTSPIIDEDKDFQLKPRQLLGQPAGPGLAFGPARVVKGASDLFAFQSGEVLVCDAVDPNMTFVVTLAAGIVERRGGMLIHGAIIAREYGLACVTGVPDAVSLIKTGNPLTVDGFLGIVTVGEARQKGI